MTPATERRDQAGAALESVDAEDREPVTTARVITALNRARDLLGPDAVSPLDPAEEVDAELETGLEDALMELRGVVQDYSGPDALDVARAAYEVADLARTVRLHTVERRAEGLSAVQRALAELRTIGSVELMLRRCAEVICEQCGFDRAILYRIEDERVIPASAFDRRDPDWDAKVKRFYGKVDAPEVEVMPLEAEMVRRRAPAIVHDADSDERTHRLMAEPWGSRGYVAAPIVPGGRVIGFIQAGYRRQSHNVDVIDRDVLWAFAEGCGYALERTILRDQIRRQRERVRELLRGADILIHDLGESEIELERAETKAAVRATASLPAGGSRIHSLLTPREIEVMELLVTGSTNKQISERLVVTEATTKSHVAHILRKLRAGNRAEAVHRYMRLLSLDHK
jgi:DNA-binding CsgD family transcriptional regulator